MRLDSATGYVRNGGAVERLAANAKMAQVQLVCKFHHLLSRALDHDNGETIEKVKRFIIVSKYQDLIESLCA